MKEALLDSALAEMREGMELPKCLKCGRCSVVDTYRFGGTVEQIKSPIKKYALIALLVLGAFFASYNFAAARQSQGKEVGVAQAPVAPEAAAAQASGGGDGCCGGSGAQVEGATTVEGDVQRLTIDTSSGSFDPNVIKAKAGVPLELTFTQAPGGCMSGVVFPDFKIDEDLTGGQKTVKLPALDPGQYTFFCQMQMVTGTLVVE